MNRDSQTRMTNDEIRRNYQIRMTKPATAQLGALGHSGFGFLSSLVIRLLTSAATVQFPMCARIGVESGYARSAAVLGRSNVSTPNTLRVYQLSPAFKPA